MAIAFARPIVRRLPSRALLKSLKARAPARPTQAATIKRPVKPFAFGFVPTTVRPRPAVAPAVVSFAEPVVTAAPPPPAPKPGTCVECGRPAPAPVAAAPAPALAAQISLAPSAAEVTGADLRVAATAPDEAPVPTRKPKVTAGLLIGLGAVIVLLAYASTVRPR